MNSHVSVACMLLIIHFCLFKFQVKIIIPNSTAGMVIGKAGNYIKHIKDESGAYVQISQKSKDMNLPERCVTIAGLTESLHLKKIVLLYSIIHTYNHILKQQADL